jgi:hypothetical protein
MTLRDAPAASTLTTTWPLLDKRGHQIRVADVARMVHLGSPQRR